MTRPPGGALAGAALLLLPALAPSSPAGAPPTEAAAGQDAEAAAAQEAPRPQGPAGRWARQGSSLVLYNSSGTVALEIPLGSWEERDADGIRVRQSIGGIPASGRFAWHVERTTAWNEARTRAMGSHAVARCYGTRGVELWSEPGVNVPKHAEPVAMNDSGEIAALAALRGADWALLVRNYLGTDLAQEKVMGAVSSVSLTPGGTCAWARWTAADGTASYTFVKVGGKAGASERRDVPVERFLLGPPRVTEDGRVFSGSKIIEDFKDKTGTKNKEAPKK